MHTRHSLMAPGKFVPLAVALSLAVLVLGGAPAYSQTYILTDLGTLGGTNTFGAGINNTGQVTGSSDPGTNDVEHAFVYTPGATPQPMMDINALLGATFSRGFGINSAGQVTGWSNAAGTGTQQAFVYTPGANPTMIPLLAGWAGSAGFAINDVGQVAGYFYTANSQNAFVYTPSASPAVIALPTIGGPQNGASGINGAGQVTGWSDDPTGAMFAFLYSPGVSPTITPLPTLGGPSSGGSEGNGINSLGQVTGASATNPYGDQHAFLYSQGITSDLGVPIGGFYSIGNGISSVGQITGIYLSDNDGFRAFVYSPGTPATMSDLNSLVDSSTPLPPNVTLTRGDAINDNGSIVADGVNSVTNVTHAYLLQPSGSSSTPCLRAGNFTICKLRPTICGSEWFSFCAPKCDLPGCLSQLVVWIPPRLGGGDPWLDGVSLKTMVPTWQQARSLADSLQVSVSTEAKAKRVPERGASAELIDQRTLQVRPVSVVGPLVELNAASDVSSAMKGSSDLKATPPLELSLPYDASAVTPGSNIRMVEFDQSKGHWVDIRAQYITRSKHLVTARVPGVGRFTVVAEASLTRGGLPSRLGRAAGPAATR